MRSIALLLLLLMAAAVLVRVSIAHSKIHAVISPALPAASVVDMTPRIAIFISMDSVHLKSYREHTNSVFCYASRWGYRLLIVIQDQNPPVGCSRHANVFFRRECHLLAMMTKHENDFDWFLVLDGDVFVARADTPLTSKNFRSLHLFAYLLACLLTY